VRATPALGLLALVIAGPLAAQDSTPPADRGVRVGITYVPGTRPRLVVFPGSGLDSVRAIVERDLDYSDRFEVLPLAPGAPAGGAAVVNYALYRTLGAEYGLELRAEGGRVSVRLHDIGAGAVRQQLPFMIPAAEAPDFRLSVHQVSDEVVRWITGTPGIAASRLLVLLGKRAYRVDSDGAEVTAVTPASESVLSPTWSPDGQSIAYTRFLDGRGPIVVQRLSTGERRTVTGTESQLNFTPAFSPDGRILAFARTDQQGGTDLYAVNLADQCCLRRLTVGRFADNLSPTYAPDGRRIGFVSTRPGSPQIYVMSSDGTDQELLAPYDYGATGASNGPEWSPDGAAVAFHRDIDRAPQVFLLEVGSRRFKQLTSSGRNTDPTWAPDGRHLAFVSDRSGRRQVWVIDTETGRIRQLPLPGDVRLPHWSRRIGGAAP
jgi:TolB protein